jgi:formate dehydrogenase subunit gamma
MFRIIVLIGIAATVVAILGHLVVFGPRRVAGPKTRRAVRRFSIWERLIHVVTVLGFLALATTGFLAVIGQRSPLHGWLWVIHVGAAPVFSFGLTLVVITWARDGLFAPCDWEWTKAFGGYLWGGKHPPAERFNGGQKVYLWAVALLGLVSLVTGLGRAVPVLDAFGQELLYQVHRYSALLFVMAAIGHLYLGTFANPGTFGAMLTGKVTPQWAEQHHPLWWKTINEQVEQRGNKPKE